ncbi:MAG TPA: hypothetical protein VNQ90_12695 [Chthoniobacteraceae bacterium]|nr:hypothetical protein [Chthoniobacteraceae bacterium]
MSHTSTRSVTEEIEELERQLADLRHRSLLELKVKLGEARHTVALLERKIQELTQEPGKTPEAAIAAAEGPQSPAPQRRSRVSVTIEQVVEAIREGATNYRQIARELGCSPITVAKKVETEGKAAGIRSSGQKGSFKLFLK